MTRDHAGSGSPRSLFGRSRADVERALPHRESVICPICRIAPQPFGTDFQGLSLARCRECGLEFQSPRPTFAQLQDAVYGDTYHPPHQAAIDDVRAWQYHRQLARVETMIGPTRRRLLDVGCGAGAFLGYAASRGWTADGTDVAVTDWARRTGARLWEGQLPDIAFGGRQYDVVRFNHVLEHTQEPRRELERARDLLTDGGVLIVGVPNMAGFSIRLKSWQSQVGLKRRVWKHYGALHHLWFFTPGTLSRLVQAAGFDVLLVETPVGMRSGRPVWLTRLLRPPLEALRAGGVIDLYGRVRGRV